MLTIKCVVSGMLRLPIIYHLFFVWQGQVTYHLCFVCHVRFTYHLSCVWLLYHLGYIWHILCYI